MKFISFLCLYTRRGEMNYEMELIKCPYIMRGYEWFISDYSIRISGGGNQYLSELL